MNIINVNIEIKIKEVPLKFCVLIRVLNSLCKIIIILIHNKLIREGINQYLGGSNKIPIQALIQFIERLKFVVGSKVENKFVIIFNLNLIWFLV